MCISELLSRLEKVKRTGRGRWLACCPAHEDHSPSLAIRELEDGRILIHCFAGCGVQEIVFAAGLELSDLFPPRVEGKHFAKRESRPFPAADVLRAIAFEATLVLIAAADMLAGKPLNEFDRDRLVVAVGRIHSALKAGGTHLG